MSNNVATNTKNEGRCSFSRKALSVATAAVLATTMVPMLPAESAWAGDAEATSLAAANAWDYAKITYSVDKDGYGRYITDLSNPMVVESIVDAYGETLTASDYTVLYVNNDGQNGDTKGTLVDDGLSVRSSGDYPVKPGSYEMVVIEGKLGDDVTLANDYQISSLPAKYNKTVVPFTIKADQVDSLAGLKAFQLNSDATDTSSVTASEYADSEFKYTGKELKIGFTLDGDSVFDITGSGISVKWTCSDNKLAAPVKGNGFYTVTDAGTYTATVYDNKTGSQATVEVVVDPIDLSKDVITIETVANKTNLGTGAGYGQTSDFNGWGGYLNDGYVYVNGEQLAPFSASDKSDVQALLTKSEDASGTTFMPGTAWKLGVYTFEISAATGSKNVIGSPVEATGAVVDDVVNFYYGNAPVSSALNGKTFYVGDKDGFDPDDLKAGISAAGDVEKFTYKVTKDGKEVTSFDEVGTYVVTLDAPMTDNFASMGHEVATFKVAQKPVSIAAKFAQIDGKALNSTFPYTGEAYVPTVAAFDAKGNKLVEGTDYTVYYTKAGQPKSVVESAVEVGNYDIYVVPANGTAQKLGSFEISKAELVAASADKAIYAYTGEAIAPTFKANTEKDWTGLTESFDASNAVITYNKATAFNSDGSVSAWDSTATKADELKEVGTYKATITVPATNKNFKNSSTITLVAEFQISKTAAFDDVAASEWYAEPISKAAELSYMTGVGDTKLFMPEAQITRAEVAQVFANMAGQTKAQAGEEYPTQFSDVDKAAWYAKAIAWASQTGIVGGYDGTDAFGTFDNATREQIATMIYRYAKAQGMDVTVKDEAAALAKYADGASVSDYAKTAMAYCVEQGVFGVDVDTLRPQDFMSRAEMAATSVRVQPTKLS